MPVAPGAELATVLARVRGMTIACGLGGGGLVPLTLLLRQVRDVLAGPIPPPVAVAPGPPLPFEGGRERDREQ